jgi:hypothetical protein
MLFTDENLSPLTPSPGAVIDSPAGRFAFTIKIGGMPLRIEAPTAHRFCEGGVLYRWSVVQAEAELLLCLNPIDLADLHEAVEVHAAFLRVQAKSGNFKVGFSAQLEEATQGFSGGYDGGQAFFSVAWHKEPTTVSLGTDDEEGLHARCGRDLPTRWSALILECGGDGRYVTSDNERWILVETPMLEPSERCQLGYAVAWGETDDEEDVGTWRAANFGNLPILDDIKPTPRGWANGKLC